MKSRKTMKKAVAALLAVMLVLALSATAFADNSVIITKNPTDESRRAGETAWFVAYANNCSSLEWTFVSPAGSCYSLDGFKAQFPQAAIQGQNSTTLRIDNLTEAMNGWSVFCTFRNDGNMANTTQAYIWVYAASYAAPTPATNPQPVYYYDEYGAYTPAHPDPDPQPVYHWDEYGPYVPAHPDPDPQPAYHDEYGAFTPAHPDPGPQPMYYDEFGAFTPAHPNP